MSASGDVLPTFTAAAVQASSIILDRDATLDKLDSLTHEASAAGADLVVFSESFIPGFPVWNLVLAPIDQHGLFKALAQNAITVPGPHVERLAGVARRHEIILSVGITERSTTSLGCLWNSNLLFDRTGRLINHRRKLVPTWAEQLSWARGDAHGLRPAETDCGQLGVLICGENTNTLARYTLLAQGEQVHVATYPPVWPTHRDHSPGSYDLARAIEIRSAAHSFEGKISSIVAAGVLDDRSIELVGKIDSASADVLRRAPRAASMILGPTGNKLAEATPGDETIVYATIDVADTIEQKQFHDIVGYYQRFDLFRVSVDQRRQQPISALDDPADTPDWADGSFLEDVEAHTAPSGTALNDSSAGGPTGEGSPNPDK